MKSKAKRILVQCGIGPDIKGYNYLVDAIMQNIEYQFDYNEPMKMMAIYEIVGRKHNQSAVSVEKCMRRAVHSAFSLYPPVLQDLFVGCIGPKGAVSNKRFINIISAKVVEGIKTPDVMFKEGWCDDCLVEYRDCKEKDRCAAYGGTDEKTI